MNKREIFILCLSLTGLIHWIILCTFAMIYGYGDKYTITISWRFGEFWGEYFLVLFVICLIIYLSIKNNISDEDKKECAQKYLLELYEKKKAKELLNEINNI